MVGDRLYTDIAMAVDAGIDSALVLTGRQHPGAGPPACLRTTGRSSFWTASTNSWPAQKQTVGWRGDELSGT
jgi:ribonucleotide monophosphatase NagD (HAD superfamily)